MNGLKNNLVDPQPEEKDGSSSGSLEENNQHVWIFV